MVLANSTNRIDYQKRNIQPSLIGGTVEKSPNPKGVLSLQKPIGYSSPYLSNTVGNQDHQFNFECEIWTNFRFDKKAILNCIKNF